ncbi:MAG TPA: hypothetical protein VLL52_06840, partial [Anaerolineae bacterium]|nr:hypothetical protein [Anaerolineae bacterium]
LAAGLLAHYDAVLFAPAITWWVVGRVWQEKKIDWPAWWGGIGLGGLVLGLFYVPFMRHPNFARTLSYLVNDRVGTGGEGGPWAWSGPEAWQMATLYNSSYYIVLGGILLVVGCVWLGRERRGLGAVLLFWAPFLFYLLVVTDPRTHIYTFFPGGIVLAAVGIEKVISYRDGWWRWLWQGGLGVWWLICAYYVGVMFVEVAPERQRSWERARPAGFVTTWESPPLYGLFGFPHQAGWRAVADEVRNGGWYGSNEEPEVANWYGGGAGRTYCPNFDTFVLVSDAQDALAYDEDVLAQMSVVRRVLINGQVGLEVYGWEEVEFVEEEAFVTEVWNWGATTGRRWVTAEEMAPAAEGWAVEAGVLLGDVIVLRGYTVREVGPREIEVVLYWEALAPLERNYQVFVHAYDGEQLWAQDDGAPACDEWPTTRWEPGQLIVDPHRVVLPEGAPEGVPLLVGMYDVETLVRLGVEGGGDVVGLER